MTREEAIKELKILKEDYWDDDGYGHETQQYDDTLLALDMAINALEQEPCDDAISRQAVLEKAYAYGYGLEPEGYCVNVENIQALPSVTPTRPTGKWIADVDRWGDIVTTVNGYRCSECNTFNADKDNFCPNCGARMIESEDKE